MLHYLQYVNFQASAPPRAKSARQQVTVASSPHSGRWQRLFSAKFGGSQSSYPKLQSISPRELHSFAPTVLHIPCAAKDDDAPAQPAPAPEPFMPEKWPDFSKKNEDPSVVRKFFNRKEEYDSIINHLNDEPSQPLLLLGPINSGKSALLRELLEKEEKKTRIVYLNCGLADISSPELMAKQLRKQARNLPSQRNIQLIKTFASRLSAVSKLLELSEDFINAAVPGEEVVNAFMADFFPKDTATDLAAVIDSYTLLLKSIRATGEIPIIVIDECNALRRWETKDETKLDALLEFLKRICKEEQVAHIVLASSDFFMVSWLSQRGFDATQIRVEVVGDLTSTEAFVYVCGGKVYSKEGDEEEWPGLMARSEKSKALGMTPEDWKKVWSVCGGNLYLLKNCVAYAIEFNSWAKAVDKILSGPRKRVDNILARPATILPPIANSGPRIWEAKHYRAAVRLMAANPFHAVRRKEVEAELKMVGMIESITADQVLLSMVEYNILALRPYSEMAKDIPREAFLKKVGSKENEDDVVTMPSAAHLAAVLDLEVELEGEILTS